MTALDDALTACGIDTVNDLRSFTLERNGMIERFYRTANVERLRYGSLDDILEALRRFAQIEQSALTAGLRSPRQGPII